MQIVPYILLLILKLHTPDCWYYNAVKTCCLWARCDGNHNDTVHSIYCSLITVHLHTPPSHNSAFFGDDRDKNTARNLPKRAVSSANSFFSAEGPRDTPLPYTHTQPSLLDRHNSSHADLRMHCGEHVYVIIGVVIRPISQCNINGCSSSATRRRRRRLKMPTTTTAQLIAVFLADRQTDGQTDGQSLAGLVHVQSSTSLVRAAGTGEYFMCVKWFVTARSLI